MNLRSMLASGLLAVFALTGCPGSRGALKEAQSPDEYAFVVAEHYNVLVNEAADIAVQTTTPENVRAALKAADLKAKPLVLSLRGLAADYVAVKSAENQAALQAALNKAVLAVAEFIRALRAAQVTTGEVWSPTADRILAMAGGAP